MAAKTTLNAKNLEALGAGRLAALLIEISMGSAASKRRLRLELAGEQSTSEVAREVRKRLSSIERSRTKVNWRRIKALKVDIETQRGIITDTIGKGDPDEAAELLWRFLELAPSIFARCDDGNGLIIESFHAACADLGALAGQAHNDGRLAERAFSAITRNDQGACDPLIPALAPALGPDGLERLKFLLADWQKEPVEAPANRVILGWGMRGPVYADELDGRRRETIIRIALEQIADAEGDVDAFIAQQSDKERTLPAIAADIGERLLAADRPAEALAAIDAARPRGHLHADPNWRQMRATALEALDQPDEAQAFRWRCFERDLSLENLRAFLRRLADFDDIEAEERAFAYARGFDDVHQALVFFGLWPAAAEMSRLVLARVGEIDGNLYEVLTPAAAALEEKYPLAATLLLRAMIDFALQRGRSGRYRHVARHLGECAAMAGRIADFGGFPDHAAYVAGLKRSHGKKHGFWSAVG